ncbi:MAG TPA: DUF4468 domain-containing protein [Bacteroidales bacterium]|nr:DUF4468 domain-containing protein [Bacteroidales bacterium]
MKNIRSIYIAFLTIIAGIASAQVATPQLPLDPDTKLITYKEVVTQTGTKEQLFNRAVEWLPKQYVNPVDATKVRNPETGLIEVRHRFDVSYEAKGVPRTSCSIDYTMRLEFKDGRYRYTISDFLIHDVSRAPVERWLDKTDKSYNPSWDAYLTELDQDVKALIESLKKGMMPPPEKKEDIW